AGAIEPARNGEQLAGRAGHLYTALGRPPVVLDQGVVPEAMRVRTPLSGKPSWWVDAGLAAGRGASPGRAGATPHPPAPAPPPHSPPSPGQRGTRPRPRGMARRPLQESRDPADDLTFGRPTMLASPPRPRAARLRQLAACAFLAALAGVARPDDAQGPPQRR